MDIPPITPLSPRYLYRFHTLLLLLPSSFPLSILQQVTTFPLDIPLDIPPVTPPSPSYLYRFRALFLPPSSSTIILHTNMASNKGESSRSSQRPQKWPASVRQVSQAPAQKSHGSTIRPKAIVILHRKELAPPNHPLSATCRIYLLL